MKKPPPALVKKLEPHTNTKDDKMTPYPNDPPRSSGRADLAGPDPQRTDPLADWMLTVERLRIDISAGLPDSHEARRIEDALGEVGCALADIANQQLINRAAGLVGEEEA